MQKILSVLLTSCLVTLINCSSITDSNIDTETIHVTIKNTDIYEYNTGIGGDEDEATIIEQAEHFEISEIFRNAETHWVAVYKYVPKSGYTGTDYVEVKTGTGSDGASPPTKIEIIKFRFQIQ